MFSARPQLGNLRTGGYERELATATTEPGTKAAVAVVVLSIFY